MEYNDKSELKPCPFCGGRPVVKRVPNTDNRPWYVRCDNDNCGMWVATCSRNTKEEAIELWNSRNVLHKKKSESNKRFTVIDKHTGEYPDLRSIARRCKWAKHLVYCDMEGFALTEDGKLILMDECGGIAYCPHDRFEIKWE